MKIKKKNGLHLHFIWSINAGRNGVYFFMGHTAKFVVNLSNFSGILPKGYLEHHESVNP